MGAAVLRSQDCLQGRLHLDAFGSRSPQLPSTKPHRKKPPVSSATTPMKPGRGCPPRSTPSPPPKGKPPRPVRQWPSPENEGATDGMTRPRRVLVMEEVKILKRGEQLKPVASPPADALPDWADSVFCPTSRLGPGPDDLPRKLGFFDLKPVYAGPGFVVSPSPSSLPLPSFCLKKSGVAGK
ncbi:uncharacterized protein LOC103997830 [Musa acuminata AAA Group]|uniref:uncharacterized protein LOC103997830 n=1 Tax=Musa acuminata AAA Group TaxID=214697 RepID=UPI0031D74421